MDIHRLHRGVRRALARASGVPQRRTSARHWTIPNTLNSGIDSPDSTDWRRRLLWARGQQIQLGTLERNDRCAIAILDATGIVISWHDRLPRARSYDPGVLSRHMSQFYLPDDVALHVPARHLFIAAEYGVDTQRGWRRRPGGEIFWGVTVMQSILLDDGELLGYSHVTRSVRGPAQHLFRPLRVGMTPTARLAVMA
ncbi:hypothetical protein [Steroidobacter sp.]|uniref:hypothetical protein n=1 Tax=Steroidobacter sp. TaxID=1978227 RepID=UPI001A3705E3|nr:hypothetical protein [Steroidobacter sp.]MBL8265688.1 hypothetical protein [Steroidobacter sp.]